MSEAESLPPHLATRLTRYIHTGMEVPKYFPGCWTTHKYYELDKLPAVNEAFAINKDNVQVVELIVKAYNDNMYTRYETIAFALTKCLLLGGPMVKETVYKAVGQVCQTPEQLLLFTKFTRTMKTGNGQGWCRSIRRWYNNRDPEQLAKDISRAKGRYGRSHKLLIKKSHFKVDENDSARNAIVKYAIYGLKKAQELAAAPGAAAVLRHLAQAEELRHCELPAAAAERVAAHRYHLDHVPGHLLTSQEIWNALLPQLSLSELLYNVQRVHNMGFLTAESATTAVVLSLLNSDDYVKGSGVTPIEVYITYCNYKKKGRPMKHEKAKVALEKEKRRRTRQVFDPATNTWQWNVKKRHPKEVKHWGIDAPPHPVVLQALHRLLDDTWLLTPATGARYLLTLDMRHNMFKGRHFCKKYLPAKKVKTSSGAAEPAAAAGDAEDKVSKKHLLAECFYNKHVTPGHAALVMALHILKREKRARLAVFTEEGVQLVQLQPRFTGLEEAEVLLRSENLGRVQLDSPIKWATQNKEKIDVFINMIDRVSRYMELPKEARGGRGPGGRWGPPPAAGDDRCPVRALEAYRAACRVPDAKLVVMSLASYRAGLTDGSHVGVLDVVGIDEHTPKLLDAFVKGQFN